MRSSYLTVLACTAALFILSFVSDKPVLPQLGIVTDLANDSLAHSAGFKWIGESVNKILSPTLTDEEFSNKLKQIKAAKCKVLSCNLFFPANLKIAGPDVVEAKVLQYADVVLSRANQAGVKFVVLGSSGSRNIPVGYDIIKAKSDFVALGKKLGQVARKHQVTIVLENLETTETNFITSLKQAAEIVREVNHPNFRLNVDIFHMTRQDESPADIIANKDLIAFCEIAEKEKRSFPGVAGDDFKPYLSALRTINYKGFIFIEGSTKNAAAEMPLSFKYLSKQIAAVYAEK